MSRLIFSTTAYERGAHLKAAITNGVPMLAIDVPSAVFDTLVRSSNWIHDEDVWKTIVASMPALQTAYALQLREAVAKRKAEGHPFILLYATREERIEVLSLSPGLSYAIYCLVLYFYGCHEILWWQSPGLVMLLSCTVVSTVDCDD